MTNEEKALRLQKIELSEKLSAVQTKLDAIEAEKARKAEIKRNYKKNNVPVEYNISYDPICKELVALIDDICAGVQPINERSIKERISKIYEAHSIEIPPNPELVYNCPNCGSQECLTIIDYPYPNSSSSYEHVRFAVSCRYCDFIGPKVGDYGEAWYAFENYLKRKGYIKD